MKIAYLEFNEDDFCEDYSVSPKRYGGGRIFAAKAKEDIEGFHIFSNPDSFVNLGPDENKAACHSITPEQRKMIREGKPIKDIIPDAHTYDLFVHHQSVYGLNLEGLSAQSCCWVVGYGERIHPNNKHVLLYNDYQNPVLASGQQVHRIVIGKPIPEFEHYKKEDFIFQCSRHTSTFGSEIVAQLCKKHGLKVYFAGPIDAHYPLLKHVDDKNVFYLGIISEEEKISYLKRARITTYLHIWPTPFNLSAIESLAYGTPILGTRYGFWPSLINGKNGQILVSEATFYEAYRHDFSQRDCYESAVPFSEENMVASFKKAFKTILS